MVLGPCINLTILMDQLLFFIENNYLKIKMIFIYYIMLYNI